MTDWPDPMAGTEYRTRGIMGGGATALVYEVEHVVLRRLFVAKIPHASVAQDEVALDRFLSEARATAAVRHPHLVEVVNFGWTRHGMPYLVMERLVGRTLRDELRIVRRLPLSAVIRYMKQALSALAQAHRRGIVHRDLKPDNVFLHRPHEANEREVMLKILDLGLAKILENVAGAPEPRDFSTERGSWVGTPRYAAPEQTLDQDIDGRADLYSLGLIAYEAIAGRGPFDDLKTEQEVLEAHAMKPPEPPSAHVRGLPRLADRVILKALEKRAEHRYQSAAEFAAAFEELERAVNRRLMPSVVVASALVSGALSYSLLAYWLGGP
jgi:serine/threonine protein kinase